MLLSTPAAAYSATTCSTFSQHTVCAAVQDAILTTRVVKLQSYLTQANQH